MVAKLDPKFSYLNSPDTPRIVQEALKELGTLEKPGIGNNPKILGWADEVGLNINDAYSRWASEWYDSDSIAWCGLFVAVCAVRANPDKREDRSPPTKYLGALEWAKFGVPVQCAPYWVGDIAVFSRKGGGHVGIIVGQTKDGKKLFVLGGNQGDQVSIMEKSVDTLAAVRRVPYLNKPAGAKPQYALATGAAAVSEA